MTTFAFVSRIAEKFAAQRATVRLLEISGAPPPPGTESFDAHDDGTWEYTEYDRGIDFDHLNRPEE
jgi:hypothetical protein